MPRRNLIYHVWPVRNSLWRWNLEQLLRRIDLFNGRRVIGIVQDPRAEAPEEVMRYLDGHGCEFIVKSNDERGEVATFAELLDRVASVDPDEVTFYGHAKGVRYGPHVTASLRSWIEALYQTALDDWLKVFRQLESSAMTGPFKTYGRFRSHRELSDWHFSGTFFWMRHLHVFHRHFRSVPQFYYGVEAWPGPLFHADETNCLFIDGVTQSPYRPDFWRTSGTRALNQWRRAVVPVPTPPDLVDPPSSADGTGPRMQQKPDEFRWWCDELLRTGVRRVLTLGPLHGGFEYHLARVFREQNRDLEITTVEMAPSSDLQATLEAARSQFLQSIKLVVGRSTAPETRQQLDRTYDAVYIDADHSYRGVKADWDLAQQVQPRLTGFHDVVDSHWHAQCRCCVSRLWHELKEKECTREHASGDWGGVGLVERQ
jgi:hypothetical protein